MSTPQQPHAVFKSIVVDRSGSMSSFQGKHTEMTHRMLMETQEEAGNSDVRTRVSLTTFDDRTNYPMVNIDPTRGDMLDQSQLQKMLYPRGCTRFNDTLIEEVKKLEKAAEDYRKSLPTALRRLDPLIVRIVIAITDGEDNSSRQTTEQCRNIMNDYRHSGGKAILMAANMDAERIGANYGFNSDRCITVHNSDEQAIEAGFRSVMRCERQMTQGIEVAPFSQLERNRSCPVQNFQDFDDNDLHSVPAAIADHDSTNFLPTPPQLQRNFNQQTTYSFSTPGSDGLQCRAQTVEAFPVLNENEAEV